MIPREESEPVGTEDRWTVPMAVVLLVVAVVAGLVAIGFVIGVEYGRRNI